MHRIRSASSRLEHDTAKVAFCLKCIYRHTIHFTLILKGLLKGQICPLLETFLVTSESNENLLIE
ncbi:hypothetical protein FOCC_FOCC000460 [Frankliniella occidentalis]|nr:hypothetical protein FOCC_FOCC000460 [Frankliniella occidentalis]